MAHRRTVPAIPQLPITSVSHEILEQIVEILGVEGADYAGVWSQISSLVPDSLSAARLLTWIPEAFGMMFIAQLGNVTLPTTFSARMSNGQWQEFNLSREPIFMDSIQIAEQMFHGGSRDVFNAVSSHSSMVNAVVSALNEGASIEGAVLQGPALVDIPGDIYLAGET